MNNGNDLKPTTSTEEIILIEDEDALTEIDRDLLCHCCTKGKLILPYNLYRFRVNRKVKQALRAAKRVINTQSTAPSSSVSHSINDVITNRNNECEFISLESDWNDSYSFSPEYLKGKTIKMSDNPIKQDQSFLNIAITFEQMLNIRKKRLNKKRQNSATNKGQTEQKSDTLVSSSTDEDIIVINDASTSEHAVNTSRCCDVRNSNAIQNCTITSDNVNCKQCEEESNNSVSNLNTAFDAVESKELLDKNHLDISNITSEQIKCELSEEIIEILDDSTVPSSENKLASSVDHLDVTSENAEKLLSAIKSQNKKPLAKTSSSSKINRKLSLKHTAKKENLPRITKENQNIKAKKRLSPIATRSSTLDRINSSINKKKRKRTDTNDSIICISDSLNKTSDDIIFVSEKRSKRLHGPPQAKKHRPSVVVIDDSASSSSNIKNLRRDAHRKAHNRCSSTYVSLKTNSSNENKNLRTIIIDGSNVAYGHANGKYFSVKGLVLAIKHFLKRGHKVVSFVPQFRSKLGESSDPKLLMKLADEGLVAFTPSREVNGIRITSYDDRFILEYATCCDGIVVSNDNYRDLLKEKEEWRHTIECRLLMYTWVGDIIMLPDDPLGKRGPRLSEFLSF